MQRIAAAVAAAVGAQVGKEDGRAEGVEVWDAGVGVKRGSDDVVGGRSPAASLPITKVKGSCLSEGAAANALRARAEESAQAGRARHGKISPMSRDRPWQS